MGVNGIVQPFQQGCAAITGNADLYGIGVRTGLYAQWVATLLTTLFNPADEVPLRVVNLIIQASLLLGLVNQSAGAGDDARTIAVDSLIVFPLLTGSLSSLTGDGVWCLDHFSGLLRALFYVALAAYGCRFWSAGVARLDSAAAGSPAGSSSSPDDPCTVVAFFNGVPATGPIRTLALLFWIICLVVAGCLAFRSVQLLFLRFTQPDTGKSRDVLGRRRSQVQMELLVLSVCLICFSVAAAEYLLHANRVTGIGDVTSVGQLIPLLVGSLGMVMTLWKMLADGLLWRKKCWLLLGRHL